MDYFLGNVYTIENGKVKILYNRYEQLYGISVKEYLNKMYGKKGGFMYLDTDMVESQKPFKNGMVYDMNNMYPEI